MASFRSDSVTWIQRIPSDDSYNCELWEAYMNDTGQRRKAYVRKFGPFSMSEEAERFNSAARELIARATRCQKVQKQERNH